MRKLVFMILVTLPFLSKGQYFEIGGFLGASNYNGDFSDEFIMPSQTHIAYGGLARYNISKWVAIKGNYFFGTISGADSLSRKYYHRKWDRNLSFKSTLLDIGCQVELNLTGFSTRKFTYKRSPYIFTGFSVLKFNPMAFYEGRWVALQPLGTEGQNLPRFKDRKYSLNQFVIPFGAGYKLAIDRNINVGFELSARKTFTDYLDDVSTTYVDMNDLLLRNGDIAVNLSNRTGEVGTLQEYPEGTKRGSPKAKDWYYFTGLTVTYSILPRGCLKF